MNKKEIKYVIIQWIFFGIIFYYLLNHEINLFIMIILWIIPALIGIRAIYQLSTEKKE